MMKGTFLVTLWPAVGVVLSLAATAPSWASENPFAATAKAQTQENGELQAEKDKSLAARVSQKTALNELLGPVCVAMGDAGMSMVSSEFIQQLFESYSHKRDSGLSLERESIGNSDVCSIGTVLSSRKINWSPPKDPIHGVVFGLETDRSRLFVLGADIPKSVRGEPCQLNLKLTEVRPYYYIFDTYKVGAIACEEAKESSFSKVAGMVNEVLQSSVFGKDPLMGGKEEEGIKNLKEFRTRWERDRWQIQINQHLAEYWKVPSDAPDKFRCAARVYVRGDGSIGQPKLSQSSGVQSVDASFLKAVAEAVPYPVPENEDAISKKAVLFVSKNWPEI